MPRGRRLDAPAKNRVVIVLTDQQLEMLDKCCYDLRWTRTDVLREGIEKVFAELPKEK